MTTPVNESTAVLTLRTYVAILPAIIMMMALLIVAEAVVTYLELGGGGMRFVQFMGPTVVAFAAHNYVLGGAQQSGFKVLEHEDPKSLTRFILRSLLIVMLLFPCAILPIFLGPFKGDGDLLGALVRGTIGASIGALLIFGLFGTMSPAVLDRADGSMGAAYRRGTFGSTWWQLVIGPGLISAIAVYGTFHLLAERPDPLSPFTPSGSFSLSWLGISVVQYLISFLATTATAVILSRAYLRWKASNGDTA